MNDQLSAVIIPFPVRHRSLLAETQLVEAMAADEARSVAPATPAPLMPREQAHTLNSSALRLSKALAGLSTALADQKEATQRWKAALDDLATKMRMLSETGKLTKTAG